jgi:RNA polymerase sigma-70 factor (ECF subfamily)
MENGEFEKIYSLYYSDIVQVCRRIIEDSDLAKDLAQEAMIKAWRSFREFRRESSARTWLHRIATNTAIDWLRKKKSHPESFLNEEGMNSLRDPIIDPCARIIARELSHKLIRAIRKLSKRERAVIVSRFAEGLSVKETAALLGLSVSIVKNDTFRAKAKSMQRSAGS